MKIIRRYFPFLKRDFIESVFILASTSLRDQYRHSFIGSLWAIIQPSMYIVVLSLVFSFIMRMNIPYYPLRLMSGMLPWNFLVTSLTVGASALVNREALLKRAVIPKTMFVIADVMAQLYTFSISFVSILIVLCLLISAPLHWTVLLLPWAMLPLLITCFSGAMLVAYIGAYIRDIGPLLGILFQAVFWTVPIVYDTAYLSDKLRPWIEHNPIYLLIRPVQLITYYGEVPDMECMAWAFSMAALVTLLSVFVCIRLRRNVIYYL